VPKVGAVFEELASPIGPVDGHDIAEMVRTFQRPNRCDGPVLVQRGTTKARLPYGRADQVGYHAQSRSIFKTGKPPRRAKPKPPSYSKCSQPVKLCEHDPTVWGSRPRWPPALASPYSRRRCQAITSTSQSPEAHAVTNAAGMATCRLSLVVAIFSPSCNGAFDQPDSRCGQSKLPVTFVLDRRRHRCCRGPPTGSVRRSPICAPSNSGDGPHKDEGRLQPHAVHLEFTKGPCAPAHAPRGKARRRPCRRLGLDRWNGRGDQLADARPADRSPTGAMVVRQWQPLDCSGRRRCRRVVDCPLLRSRLNQD